MWQDLCCLVTAVRDGMNLIPYEYIICRQGNPELNKTIGLDPSAAKKSMLVVSEFIGYRNTLTEWFSSCGNLGLGAEHGQMMEQSGKRRVWYRFDWKQIAEPVMILYTETRATTDGSTVETKETALVWNYQFADPYFGSCQAKELMEHLESMLTNDPVSVKTGQQLVEVKPHGVNKGSVAERLLKTMQDKGKPLDFILCVGDDRSEEDMFEVIIGAKDGLALSPVAEIFACTVGQKPSKAKYYLHDTAEIDGLSSATEQTASTATVPTKDTF
ncbi:hypothetical protein AALP_AAs42556U000300 [Arabis alpina]|uniref:Trehalose 6-phosphate phosphatase n=1 Tax=Arabis alpina TaxID=50452 RepID=A0A087FYI0_ARAAL|nr:hypothetical protein AALP_AAs42556U000300 [Arabis alpina]